MQSEHCILSPAFLFRGYATPKKAEKCTAQSISETVVGYSESQTCALSVLSTISQIDYTDTGKQVYYVNTLLQVLYVQIPVTTTFFLENYNIFLCLIFCVAHFCFKNYNGISPITLSISYCVLASIKGSLRNSGRKDSTQIIFLSDSS